MTPHALAGAPKGKHRAQRRGRRHGYEVGSVVMGGVRIAILCPRVRGLQGKERVPPTYPGPPAPVPGPCGTRRP